MNGIHRIDRRGFLRTGTGALLAAPLVGLYGRQAMAQGRMEPIASPYGPVRPVADATTGLELLQLPEGFTYQSYGWAGDPMDDGAPTPLEHDGMAVVRSRDVGGEQEITLIRNHESKVQPLVGLIGAPAAYDANEITDDDDLTGHLSGGTTRLIYRGDRWVSSSPNLGGTIDNCAGGATPWGTWLTCEEDLADFSDAGGLKHGYVFEVSPVDGETTGEPIVAMGRFDHEAVAVDPATRAVYLTEDARNQAGLYRFVPADASGRVGSLAQGGQLFMAKVAGEDRVNLLDPEIGDTHALEWVRIEEPDLGPQPFTEAPFDGDNLASGPFVQGREAGALRFSRLEGIWHSPTDGLLYVVDTSAGVGDDEDDGIVGQPGYGEGAVWTYDPASETLTCLWKSDNPLAGNNPDNITVSPRGGVLMCEDGGGVADEFGQGERLLGLTPAGETYVFAKNNVQLDPSALSQAGKSAEFVEAVDHRDNEWAGATFDPTGRVLFVNIPDARHHLRHHRAVGARDALRGASSGPGPGPGRPARHARRGSRRRGRPRGSPACTTVAVAVSVVSGPVPGRPADRDASPRGIGPSRDGGRARRARGALPARPLERPGVGLAAGGPAAGTSDRRVE